MALPNGAKVFIEQTRGSDIEVSAISNSANPVATVASTGDLIPGDYVLVVESVWPDMKNRVLRVKALKADESITLEGDKSTDTSNVNAFPPGGASILAKIESWIEVPCVSDIAKSGGEQQFYTKQCLADDREKQIPTFKSATSLAYTFDFDYSNPITALLIGYDKDGKVRAMRMNVPKASYPHRTFSGTPSFDDIPDSTMNQDETTVLTLSLDGKYIHMKDFTA